MPHNTWFLQMEICYLFLKHIQESFSLQIYNYQSWKTSWRLNPKTKSAWNLFVWFDTIRWIIVKNLEKNNVIKVFVKGVNLIQKWCKNSPVEQTIWYIKRNFNRLIDDAQQLQNQRKKNSIAAKYFLYKPRFRIGVFLNKTELYDLS